MLDLTFNRRGFYLALSQADSDADFHIKRMTCVRLLHNFDEIDRQFDSLIYL